MRHTTFLSFLALCLPAVTDCGRRQRQANNPPKFPWYGVQIWLAKMSKTGTEILRVPASDPDADQLFYSVEPTFQNEYVSVEENTGIIRAAMDFSDIKAADVTFYVVVRDRQDPDDPEVKVEQLGIGIALLDLPS